MQLRFAQAIVGRKHHARLGGGHASKIGATIFLSNPKLSSRQPAPLGFQLGCSRFPSAARRLSSKEVLRKRPAATPLPICSPKASQTDAGLSRETITAEGCLGSGLCFTSLARASSFRKESVSVSRLSPPTPSFAGLVLCIPSYAPYDDGGRCRTSIPRPPC